MNIKLEHVFSVEFDEGKREFLKAAHAPGFCLFDDVDVFSTPEKAAFCHTCGRHHKLPDAVDLLVTGPSCKNFSKMFSERTQYADCC